MSEVIRNGRTLSATHGRKYPLGPVILCLACLAPLQARAFDFDEAGAKAHCAGEWANDFRMQEYCLGQMKDGFEEFSRTAGKETDKAMLTAFAKCADEWGIEWNMVEYCSQQQMSGRDKLGIVLNDLPADVATTISETCASDWSGDFAMEAYCAEQNADAWKKLNGR